MVNNLPVGSKRTARPPRVGSLRLYSLRRVKSNKWRFWLGSLAANHLLSGLKSKQVSKNGAIGTSMMDSFRCQSQMRTRPLAEGAASNCPLGLNRKAHQAGVA